MKQILPLIISVLIFSCSKYDDNSLARRPQLCDSIRFTYIKDIKPIIERNCLHPYCHAAGGEAGYDYTTYAGVADRARSGRMEDRIDLPLNDIQHMPRQAVLSDCDYFQLKTWIDQGFPEN
jgi:hypothetical protein